MNINDQFFSLIAHENQIENMPKQFLVRTNVLLLHQKIDQYRINLQSMYHHPINSAIQNEGFLGSCESSNLTFVKSTSLRICIRRESGTKLVINPYNRPNMIFNIKKSV